MATVRDTTTENKINIVRNTKSNVTVTQPSIQTVEILTGPLGPSGTNGIPGTQGPAGPSGSLTISSSLGPIIIDGNLTLSGSIIISGSGDVITSSDTGSFITNSQTGSFLTNSQTGSFLTNSQTGSFITNSQTSSMTVLSSSFATTASFISSTFISSSAAASGFGSGGGGGSTIDTGSLGSTTITGSLTVSGSNTFTNIGSFSQTGDATITGSLTISGSFNAFRVNSSNLVLGDGAGFSNTGPRNVFLGQNAGYTNTGGDDNVCIGYAAGYALSTNASDFNVFIGRLAGAGGTSPAARMSDANYNIGIGQEALLYLTSGDSNIGLGFRTLRNISSGKYNLAFGDAALYNTDTGQNNIGIGRSAGNLQTSGTGNITIGSGSQGVAGESNQLRIGNGNTLTTISASLETGNIILQGDVSSSAASTSSFGTYLGDGSQLTGISAGSSIDTGSLGSTTITGSLTVSGSITTFDINMSTWTLGADGGSNYYYFTGPGDLGGTEQNPDIHLIRGQKYRFYNPLNAHPFQIQDTGGSAFSTGVTNNGVQLGFLSFDVPMDGPTHLLYQCTAHAAMKGNIYIANARIASGSFSGSFQGDGSQLTGISAGSTIDTGSLGSTTITGSLTVSGSNTFTNIGSFSQTGDATITGSLSLSGSFIPHGTGTTTNIIIGKDAAPNITSTSDNNVLIGNEAGGTGTLDNADANVCIGYQAGYQIDGGDDNIAIGNQAGYLMDGPTGTIAIGAQAMRNAENNYGVGIGHYAGRFQENNPNIFIGGLAAGGVAGVSRYNIVIGYQSAYLINDGYYNTILGNQAGYSINDGYSNIFIGRSAGYNVTDGDGNIIIGSGSLAEAGTTNQLRIGNGNTLTTISASLETGDVIFASTASAAYFVGDGSQLTGISAGSSINTGSLGSTTITGSLTVSGSGGATIQSSGSTVFSVIGSEGDLFTVTDNLTTGSLFSVKDISGIPLLDVTANLTIPDVVTIGQSNLVIDSGSLEVVGNTTLTGNISSSAVSTASFGTYLGDGSQLTGISAGSSIDTGSLGDSTFTGDITASGDISLPTNSSTISFTNGTGIRGRFNGSYPGMQLYSGNIATSKIWFWKGEPGSLSAPTASFNGGLIESVGTLKSSGNVPLIIKGGNPSNDANDGIRFQTADASNAFQTRFEIESDGATSDAYFTNITGLGINDTTPTATLDVNGNINTTSHITASGNISSSGNIIALDLNLFGGDIDLKNAGAQSNIKFYCESANAHYTKLQAAPHSAYSGNPTVTLPAYAFDFAAPSFQSDITASGNVSSSAVSTASFGTYLGDGSQLTGISSGGGTSTMIASGSTSASADPGTGIVVNHSGSTAFSVIGDTGTLFSIDDSLTGTLFSANDISGFPVLQADSTGEVYLGKSPQSLYTTAVVSSTTAATTHSLSTLSTSSYDGAFFEYTAVSASNARAGNIMSVWNGNNIVFTETTTTDIGNTSDLTAEVIISQSQAQLVVYGANASYKVKTIIKAI